ncbi:MAG TPA: DUF1444 family protein [Methylophaga aminisulfidivorans]|jgi:uncharacterized protein YtpQ (UPF0354 family)|uniref:DUF1444 family protein n=1 Tax=Methylophaga TaxID=40222 RepID=UPI00175284D9|nr:MULTISPECIES: DUF1444 family protein [Methylophaga]HIC47597.1 DUF1444 family protein [Methylophaga sp.]HIM39397.1 DUF1444 family protein [Methylophaga aminisulfidivorans]
MKPSKLIIFSILICLNTLAQSSTLSKSEFTKEFLKEISSEIKESKFVVISDLKIHTNDIAGYELNIFLDNAYDAYNSGQRSLTEVFNDQIKSIKNQQSAYSDNNIKSIFPVLKPKTYLEIAKKQLRDSGYDKETLPFYVETLNDDMYVLYVFDTPESMRFVSPEDVEKLNIDTSLIRSIASKNLDNYYHKIGAQLQLLDTKGNGTVYMFAADENYEASALVSSLFFEQASNALKGDFVVFTPARNLVLLVAPQDTLGLQIASKLAFQGYSELGYSISPYGYKKVNGNWKRLLF